MSDEGRTTLRRKYLSLGAGELTASAVGVGVAATLVMPRLEAPNDSAALWSALGPLLVILVQAGCYWLMARSWVERTPMPATLAGMYRAFRILDAVLLAAGLVGVVVWLPHDLGVALGVLAVWLVGVIEYVNYFVARLAYPIWRWPFEVVRWRTPRLIQDVNSAR